MPRTRVLAAVVALILAAWTSSESLAQRYGGSGQGYGSYGRNQSRNSQPGVFDYYLLSLSWSPTFCASQPRNAADPQCNRSGRPYAFVLHGLWPQFERGWPQDCASPDRGFVPRDVADRMLDIMPSLKLVFHEYRKHGTCSGLGVNGYFEMARSTYERVKIPARFRQVVDERLFVSPSELIQEFVSANPGLRPDMMVVSCSGPGNRLQEVRICVDKQGGFRPCGGNENQRRLCSAPRMYVPPVRSGAGAPADDRPTNRTPMPGSRPAEQKSL